MRILLAEDEAALRHALTVLLERNCYTVDAVDNGQDALEYLRTGDYGCAVLDVMMPRLDGFSVVRQMRQEKNPVPVLLLSRPGNVVPADRFLESVWNPRTEPRKIPCGRSFIICGKNWKRWAPRCAWSTNGIWAMPWSRAI